MRVIIRDDLTLKYEDGGDFQVTDLFIKLPRGERRKEYISFDLTIVASVVLSTLKDDYEYVPTIKDIKTDYQWSNIESPTRLYMIATKYASWTCLSARMGLDEDQENTFKSFKVNSVYQLYKKSIKMGLNRLTLASSALNTFEMSIETGKLIINHQIYDVPKTTMSEWRGYEDRDVPYMDVEYRSIFRGGMVFGKRGQYENMSHIDRRSMYPSTASFFRMPYGIPTTTKEEETDLELVNPAGILNLKEGKIPMIGFANPQQHKQHALSGRMGALLNDVLLKGDIWFFKFEWDVILRMYDFEGGITDIRYVRTVEPTHLKKYFEICYEQKSKLVKGSDEYISVKKLLNSLYGKLVIKLLR